MQSITTYLITNKNVFHFSPMGKVKGFLICVKYKGKKPSRVYRYCEIDAVTAARDILSLFSQLHLFLLPNYLPEVAISIFFYPKYV